MKFIYLLFLLILSCKIGQAQVTVIDSFTHGGIMRTYRLYIPAMYNGSSAVPVVLNLHGYTSNAVQQEFYGDFRPIADTANFIIAHPDGTFDGNNDRFWNAFGAPSPDDVGFLSALLDTIISGYNINQNRIYSTGMSNGGYMSYLLACSLSNRIAAIASVTGTMTTTMKASCAPTHPSPVMVIHGTADAVVPFFGNASNLGADTVVKYWVGVNHCNPIPTMNAVPDIVPGDGCTAEHYLYSGGDQGSTVEFYKIIGGGHTWPGAPIAVGVTNMDFSASKEIWRFFSKYSLNNLATSIYAPLQKDTDVFTIYPNPTSGYFSIHFSKADEKEISIFDALGRCIHRFVSNKMDVNAELTQRGIYYLKVNSKTTVSTQKILIE